MSIISDSLKRIKPSPTIAVSTKARELKAAGKDVIGLGAGEPDFDTPLHIKEAAIKAIKDGHTKYTAIDGTLTLKKAIINKFKQDNDLIYDYDQIIVSSGAKQTLFNLCMGLLQHGDEAIIPSPYWVSYPDMVRIADATPRFIETSIESNFKISPKMLKDSLNNKTRLIFLNSPSNPTGSCYTKKS